jgi:hypothetical protein
MKIPRRKNVPDSTGRFVDIENSLDELLIRASQELQVSKTHLINDCIRFGLQAAIKHIKYK